MIANQQKKRTPARIAYIILALCYLLCTVCAQAQNIPKSPSAFKTCKRWQKDLFAHISNVSLSENGNYILVTTSGEKGPKNARMRLFTSKGKLVFNLPLTQTAKSQAISAAGDLLIVNTYDDKLVAFNNKGKKLWEREHLGRPFVLNKTKRVLIFHDEDSETQRPFATYDFSGKEITSTTKPPSLSAEPLDVFVSEDQSLVLVTQKEGVFSAFTPEGDLVFQEKAPGEIASIAAQASEKKVFVLLSNKRLIAYDYSDKKLKKFWSIDLKSSATQFEAVAVIEENIILYGNPKSGQNISAFRKTDGSQAWNYVYPNPANYTSQIRPQQTFVALQIDLPDDPKTTQVVGITRDGQAQWVLNVPTSDGIYSYSVSEKALAAAIGAGDYNNGSLFYYGLRCK